MHISLETFNQLLHKELERTEHGALMDHVLDCDVCSARFKVLHQLDLEMNQMLAGNTQEQAPRFRLPLKYALGVAAVMVMAITPYLTRGKKMVAADIPSTQIVQTVEDPLPFSVLDDVRAINFQASIGQWQQEPDVRQLISGLQ